MHLKHGRNRTMNSFLTFDASFCTTICSGLDFWQTSGVGRTGLRAISPKIVTNHIQRDTIKNHLVTSRFLQDRTTTKKGRKWRKYELRPPFLRSGLFILSSCKCLRLFSPFGLPPRRDAKCAHSWLSDRCRSEYVGTRSVPLVSPLATSGVARGW